MSAWCWILSSVAHRNGANIHAPGDLPTLPHTVMASRPPGHEDAAGLVDRARGRAPDAAEAGHHVEGLVVPRELLHVTDSDVAVGIAVARDRDQPG